MVAGTGAISLSRARAGDNLIVGTTAVKPPGRRLVTASAEPTGAKALTLDVNKRDGDLLHEARVRVPNDSAAAILVTRTRCSVKRRVELMKIASPCPAPKLGRGCKGGAGDGYGCAHYLKGKEGAHARP
jgi:hypothetical protein